MRKSRLKAPPHHPLAYYHCVSRVVDRKFVLGPEEKEESSGANRNVVETAVGN